MGMGQNLTTRGPQVLVLGSIYQGNPFWVPIDPRHQSFWARGAVFSGFSRSLRPTCDSIGEPSLTAQLLRGASGGFQSLRHGLEVLSAQSEAPKASSLGWDLCVQGNPSLCRGQNQRGPGFSPDFQVVYITQKARPLCQLVAESDLGRTTTRPPTRCQTQKRPERPGDSSPVAFAFSRPRFRNSISSTGNSARPRWVPCRSCYCGPTAVVARNQALPDAGTLQASVIAEKGGRHELHIADCWLPAVTEPKKALLHVLLVHPLRLGIFILAHAPQVFLEGTAPRMMPVASDL